MKSSTRVLINTIIQYFRTIITVSISLYTSRIVLYHIGVDDYGIYTLIGGIVSMFSFISNSLSTTTQRYLSFNMGKKDELLMQSIFNNSLITQTIISITFCISLFALTNYIFNYLINIPPERLDAGKIVFYLMVISLFFNLQSTPYLAVLIARENIVYSSLIQIADGIIKLPIAISLIYISYDKLIWYSICGCILIILNYFCYYIYCRKKYHECQNFKLKSFDFKIFKEMFSFTSWMLYSTGCVVGRTQGIAILLNNFYTTAVNAAYGIGLQVSSQLAFLSNALTTAIRPQIIKSEGAGNRKKTIRLSEIACKLAFILMGIVSIPTLIHMDILLSVWLINVPEYAKMFCQFTLFAVWIDQLTYPLSIANAAIGNVKIYSLWVNTIKIITLPFVFIALYLNCSIITVMVIYVIFECLCMFSRLVFLKININLNIIQFIKNVIIPLIIPTIITCTLCFSLKSHFSGLLIILNYIISFVSFCTTIFVLGLTQDEKVILKTYFKLKK